MDKLSEVLKDAGFAKDKSTKKEIYFCRVLFPVLIIAELFIYWKAGFDFVMWVAFFAILFFNWVFWGKYSREYLKELREGYNKQNND